MAAELSGSNRHTDDKRRIAGANTTFSTGIDTHDVPPATEQMVAQWLTRVGRKVIGSNGRLWLQIAPGFYQPVCLLTASSEKLTDFEHVALGWRAALHNEHAHLANGSIPTYLRTDIPNFTI